MRAVGSVPRSVRNAERGDTLCRMDDVDHQLYHAAMPEDWAAAYESGEYTMSTRNRTLADEGFIHASTRAQVEGVANRFYLDVAELVLLTIDPAKIDADIKWEPPAPGVDELFPHIYGPLPIAAVVATAYWFRSSGTPGPSWSLASL
jgi:glutathione S-transferase